MDKIKVVLVYSSDLQEEQQEIEILIPKLNKLFRSRAMELELVNWEDTDSASKIEEYNRNLDDSEICITLYWKQFKDHIVDELETAYERLKRGETPNKLYVYFKNSPEQDVAKELAAFRDSFASKYGHFYCTFDNVDTMRLNFLMQLEVYQKDKWREQILKLENGKVQIDGVTFVDLKNIPFNACNDIYLDLQKQLSSIEDDIVTLEGDESLKSELWAKHKDRKDVREKIDELQKALLETARTITSMYGVSSSDRIRRASEQFEKGNYKGANAILDLEEIKADSKKNIVNYKEGKELIESSHDSIKSIIEEYKLKANLIVSDVNNSNRINEAFSSYDSALNVAQEIGYDKYKYASILFSYANFAMRYNSFKKTIELFEMALAIYEEYPNNGSIDIMHKISVILCNLGTVYRDMKQYEKSESYYIRSLEICLSLGVDTFYNYARILSNLALLYQVTANYKAAEKHSLQALEVAELLEKNNPGYYLDLVSGSLNNLALLYHEIEDYKKAEEYALKCLNVYKKIEYVYSNDLLYEQANAINNAARIYFETNRYEKAKSLYFESIAITRKLAKVNPELYLPKVAAYLNNLAALYQDINDFTAAEDLYHESYDIINPYVNEYTEVYLNEYILIITGFAHVYKETCRIDSAITLYHEALELLTKYSDMCFNVYLPKISEILNDLANTYMTINNIDEAEACYMRSLEIAKAYFDHNDDSRQNQLANTLNNIALFYKAINQYSKAEDYSFRCLTIREQQILVNENANLHSLAKALNNIGLLYIDYSKFDKANKYLQRSLNYYIQLAEVTPSKYTKYLITTYNNLASGFLQSAQYTEAERYALKSFDLAKTHVVDNFQIYGDSYAGILIHLGILYRATNRGKMSEGVYLEALEIKSKLAQDNPNAYLPDVALIYNNLSVLYRVVLKEYIKAEECILSALGIREELAERLPDTYLPIVADSLTNLGGIYSETSRYSEADKCLNRALNIYESFEFQSPGVYIDKLHNIRQSIAILDNINNTNNIATKKIIKLSLDEIEDKINSGDNLSLYDYFTDAQTSTPEEQFYLGLSLLRLNVTGKAYQIFEDIYLDISNSESIRFSALTNMIFCLLVNCKLNKYLQIYNTLSIEDKNDEDIKLLHSYYENRVITKYRVSFIHRLLGKKDEDHCTLNIPKPYGFML